MPGVADCQAAFVMRRKTRQESFMLAFIQQRISPALALLLLWFGGEIVH